MIEEFLSVRPQNWVFHEANLEERAHLLGPTILIDFRRV
jgi:hypothetical protein